MANAVKPSLISSTARLPGGLHYAWAIVGILSLVQVIGVSISMAVGVVIIPLSDPDGAFGWSIVTIGMALMVYYLVGAIFSPITGWLGDRYGSRSIMLWAGLVYLGSMGFVGIMTEPWQFFLGFGVLLSLTQSMCMVPLLAAVTAWFRRRLGLGVGIILAAGGVGTAAMAPVLGILIDEIGWRSSFWVIGALGGGTLLALTIFYRNQPADVGLKPYGSREGDAPEAVRSKAMEKLRVKVFNQHIRATRAFWNLPIIHGLGCAGHGIVLIYTTYIAYDRGVSYIAAVIILSVISVFSIGGRFITPIVAERFGGKPIMAASLFIQGVTVLVLFWAHDVWMFYLFGLLFGIGFGGEMSAYLVVNRQYFGSGPIATCYGFQNMGALIGHAIATGLAGLVLYVTGSYNAILVMSIIFSLVGVGVIMSLEPTSRVLIPDWEQSLPRDARTSPLELEPKPILLHSDE